MNIGILSGRYAKALLLLTEESGSTERVYAQVKAMLADPDSVPPTLEPDLQKFIALLIENKRIDYVKYMLSSFERQYLESRHLKKAVLTTVVESPDLERKLRVLIKEKTGFGLELTTVVDPSLIGGFKFEVDDLLLDASVSTQIRRIRSAIIEKNVRIV